MIGFNHAAIGGLIGAALPLPLALPFAVGSHFILDALPHFGVARSIQNQSRFWKTLFTFDVLVTLSLATIPLHREHYAVLLCGFAAVVPDFVWLSHILRERSYDFSKITGRYALWHAAIQRYERPWGIYIEAPLAATLCYCVLKYV